MICESSSCYWTIGFLCSVAAFLIASQYLLRSNVDVAAHLMTVALIVLLCEMHTWLVLHEIQPAWFVDQIGALEADVGSSKGL